jgi:hypothetical protein
MRIKIIIVLMFTVVCLFGKQKSYTLNYKPKGKIVKMIFGNCILYTDSTSLFITAPTLINSQYYNKEEYNNVCKTIRTILKNHDTLLVDAQFKDEKLDSLTVNGFGFELVAFKLIQKNKANIYSLNTKLYVKRVLIQTLKQGELYDFLILDKQTKEGLIGYYAPPVITLKSTKYKRFNLHGQKGKTYYTDTVKLDSNGVPPNKSELYFPPYIFYDKYDYPMYNGDSEKDKIKYKKIYALEKNKRFSEALAVCYAPIFYTKPQTGKKLRILVIPTFSEPFCITIDNNDEPLLSIDILCGKGGYSYGEPVTRFKKNITKLQADSLIGVFSNSKSVHEKTIPDEPSDWTDGTSYIVEYIPANKYYVYFRHVEIFESILSIIDYSIKLTNAKIDNGR